MSKKQTREELGVKKGDQIVIKGEVTFAKLDKPIDGAELEKQNAKRKFKTGPYRTITIENLEIVAGQGTPLAQFHGQEVYTSKATNNQAFNMESKSPFAPVYGHIQEDGSVLEIEDPLRNPEKGQVVYLMINAFASKGYSNLGSTFDNVVFEKGDIEFYEGGGSSLAGFGKIMGIDVESAPADANQAPVEANTQQGFGQAPVAPAQETPAQEAPAPAAAPNPFGQTAPEAPAQEASTNPFAPKGTPATGGPADNPFA